jgi:hypothetical protein
MVRFAITAAVSIALAWPAAAVASPVACNTFITSHIAWMGSSTKRRIGAKFARVKITSDAVAPAAFKWGHVSVSEGAFAWHGDEMSGRFLVAFNDRGFDPSKRDITDITLRANGTGEILLRSWGDTKLVLSDLRCDSAGFPTAIESEGNGRSMITLSFRRETF